MRKSMLYIGILFIVGLFNCKPETPPTPIVESPIIWKQSFEKIDLSSPPIYYKDMIIIGHPSFSGGYWVYSYNALTGDSIWQTKIENTGAFCPLDDEGTFLYKDKVVFSDGHRFFVIDAYNGEILWFKKIDQMRAGSCVIDDYLYKVKTPDRLSSSLYRYDINSGAEEKLFTINCTEYGSNYSPCLNLPVKWIHPNGNEILIMQNRTFGWFVNNEPKMDILAWDLTADSMLWYVDSLDGYSSMSRPAIDGDKVFFYGYVHAYCIDAATGKTLWSHVDPTDDDGDFITANLLIIDEKFIVKPDGFRMHAVNKETGQHIWTNTETAPMPALMTVHKDTIWFSSGGVVAIDANTGEKLIDWNNDHKGSWIFPVAHHPTKGYIYTSDATYLYCLDPNKMK
jgi:outer membrane protein assembly factor BamB